MPELSQLALTNIIAPFPIRPSRTGLAAQPHFLFSIFRSAVSEKDETQSAQRSKVRRVFYNGQWTVKIMIYEL